ncbi:MAG: hypothetical protein M9887_04520 [Chitinophagales bacterium]|nr:hypothetical protein [Chitinophagales bacterium]
MKKSILAIMLLAVFATTFTSCKKDKDKDEDEVVNLDNNKWDVDGTVVSGLGGMVQDSILFSLSQNPISVIGVKFGTNPTNGSYDITGINLPELPSDLDPSTMTPEELQDILNSLQNGEAGLNIGVNQCVVLLLQDNKLYVSVPDSGKKVKVTVENGKVNALVPSVSLKELGGATSITVSANIIQTL